MKAKIAVAVVMALGLTSGHALAAGNNGQVFFSGEVVDAPCNLAPGPDGTAVQVPFGQLSMSQLNAGQQNAQPFTIKLEGCSLSTTTGTPPDTTTTTKTVSMTFDAQNTNTANTLINASGTATGLGIGIEGYTFGTEKPLTGMHDGNNALTFTAVAKKADAKTDVTAGNFSAVSNFTISYK